MYTSEVRFTDRVFSLGRDYLAEISPDTAPPSPNLHVLYQLVTGDVGDPVVFPLPGVRWATQPQDIAIRVVRNATDELKAELVHFGAEPRDMGAHLLRLQDGAYTWNLACDGQGTQMGNVEVLGTTTVAFSVHEQTPCVFHVVEKDDDG
jgi:hypothetical protein